MNEEVKIKGPMSSLFSLLYDPLRSFSLCQALGVPTGRHGAFHDYQVDAISLEISSRVVLTNKARKNDFILRGGQSVLIYIYLD